MKHATLQKIALLASLIIALITFAQLLIIHFIFYPLTWLMIILLSVFSFVASYVVIYFLVDSFVYRRIKVLYKNIHQLKTGKQQIQPINEQDPISEVEQEVKNYSINKSAEIAELKKMEQYRKEFLGDVSHELKTPIFNTQGYIETLLNGAINDDKVNISYLKKASKNLDRLNSIVEGLLVIAQKESDQLKLNKTKFDIIALTQEVIENNEVLADNRDISVKFKKETAKNKQVFADKEQVEIVLNNLINNAIKYGKEDGTVLIGVYDMEENILLEVTDNGPGIEQKYLPRLFDRFFRVDKHRSRVEGGNGLGLSICKHIMDAHGQSIHVRSTIGVGTTFGITLSKA